MATPRTQRATPRTPRMTDGTAQIGRHKFAFNRRTYDPVSASKMPLAAKISRVSIAAVAAIFSSEARSAEPGLGTRESAALAQEWGSGKEVNRVLERQVSQYLANPGRAAEMGLAYWMENFKWFLDIHAILDTPADTQKKRIIRSAEKAILSFSARCSAKAAQLPFEHRSTKDKQKELLLEIGLFLKRLVGMLSEQGEITLQNDIDSLDSFTGISDKPPKNLGI